MPIYEYKCQSFAAINEFIVFNSSEKLECKSCKSTDLEKLMSAHNTGSSSPQFGGMPGGGCCGGSPGSCGMPPGCCCGM